MNLSEFLLSADTDSAAKAPAEAAPQSNPPAQPPAQHASGLSDYLRGVAAETAQAEAEALKAAKAEKIRLEREAKHRALREARYAEQAKRREAEAQAAQPAVAPPPTTPEPTATTPTPPAPPAEAKPLTAEDAGDAAKSILRPGFIPKTPLQVALDEESERFEAFSKQFKDDLQNQRSAIDVRTGKTIGEMEDQARYNQDFMIGAAEAWKSYWTSTEPIKNAARFPARVMVNTAEGVVAVPTLVAVGADALLKKAGSDTLEPIATAGLKTLRTLEDLKQNELAYQSENGVKLSGPMATVMSGLEMVTEIMATKGATTLVNQGVKQVGKKATKQVAKHVASEAAEQVGKRALTEVEEIALKRTAIELGEEGAKQATKEGVQKAATIYTKHLTKEQLKAATKEAVKNIAKPSYYKVSASARNGLETYEAYRQMGEDEGTAALMMLGDTITTYAILGLSDAAGSYSGVWTRSGYQSRMMRLLSEDSASHLYLTMETGAAAMKIMAAGVSQGGSTYAHLKFVQNALGEEQLSDEQIARAAFSNGLFGMGLAAGTQIPLLRQAYLADKQAILFRSQQATAAGHGEVVDAQGAPQTQVPQLVDDFRPQAGQTGWRPLVVNPNGGAQVNVATPVAVHANGNILFADGMVYRPGSNDYVTSSGVVVSPEGEVITITPGDTDGVKSLTVGVNNPTTQGVNNLAAEGVNNPTTQGVNNPTTQGVNNLPEPTPEPSPTPAPEQPEVDLFGQPITPVDANASLGLFDLIRSGDVRTVNVPISEIKVNDRIVQFKRNADAVTGVVEGDALQGEYQALPPKPIVVMQFNDGSMEVVTGRHRLDLAKRNELETIPAAVIRESDGWTPEKAKTLDALDNILDEKGSDQDFIAFFRNAGIDRETAEAKGPISRRKGRNAYAVATQGTPEMIDVVMNEDPHLTADKAAAIAREAPVGSSHADSVQRAVMQAVMQRHISVDDAAIMARSLVAGLSRTGERLPEQGDLFGADDTALLFAEEEARYAAMKRREALQAVQRLNAAISKGDALSLKADFAQQLGITDTANPEQIKAAIQTLKTKALAWENYYTDPTLYQEAHAYAIEKLGQATPLFQQADGSFLTSPEMDVMPGRAPTSTLRESNNLPEEMLEISSKPMPDVTKMAQDQHTPEAVHSPVRPYGQGSGRSADGMVTIDGERIMTSKDNYHGRTMPLGGTPNSPAMQSGLVNLSIYDLVSMYRQMTDGHVPTILSKSGGNFRGRYWIGKNRIELISQIFGLADASDVDALKSKLQEVGFFQYLDEAWLAAVQARAKNKAEYDLIVAREKGRSQDELRKHLKKLIDLRVRNRVIDGNGARVMAHELWHMIDDQDGGLRGRGNVLGHLAVLKGHLKHTLDGLEGNLGEYIDEARNFIMWWFGTNDPKYVRYYFTKPSETIAEMGAAFFVNPSCVKERAPLWYAALQDCLQKHPGAQHAYDQVIHDLAYGNSTIGRTLAGTWSPEYAQALNRIQEDLASKANPKMLGKRLTFHFWDRRAPLINLYRQVWRERLARVKELGSPKDYNDVLAVYRKKMQQIEKLKLDFTRGAPNKARLFLVDVNGVVASSFKAVDENPDVAWQKVSLYAHLNRVRGSIRGRATAYGVDAPTARKELVEMTKREGFAGMRKIIKAAQAFRAVYQQQILEHPAFKETFGDNFYELCLNNTDYVTFKHTFTPEELANLKESLEKAEPGAALEMVGGRLQSLSNGGTLGGSWMKPLTGSFRATLDPLQETIKTAVGILNCIEYNRVISGFADLFTQAGSPFVRTFGYGKGVVPKGWDAITYLRGGKRCTLTAPRVFLQGFRQNNDLSGIQMFNAVSRVFSHYMTTANPAFVLPAFGRDIAAARINVPTLNYSKPGQLLPPVIGDALLTIWGALGKASWAQALSQVPGFNLVLNENTLAYWLPIARETAKLVQTGQFAEALAAADAARERGDLRRAELLEYSVNMARHALGDGIFLHYANTKRNSYERTDWERLQRHYTLRFGETSQSMREFARGLLSLPFNEGKPYTPEQVRTMLDHAAKGLAGVAPAAEKLRRGVQGLKPEPIKTALNIVRQPLRVPAALFRSIEAVGEWSSVKAERLANTVKLAALMSLHYHSLGGKMGYDEQNAEKIALKVATDAGDPINENRGEAAALIETFWRPFANVAVKCAVRPLRIALVDPARAKMEGDKTRFKEAKKDAAKTIMKIGTSAARLWLWSAGIATATALIVEACKEAGETEEETRDRLRRQPWAGPLFSILESIDYAQKSCSRYIRENYSVFPIHNIPGRKGSGTSIVLTVPIADDVKPAWLMINAGLEAAGSEHAIQGSGANRVMDYVGSTFGLDGNQAPLSTAIGLLNTALSDDNPSNRFTGERFFSDEAMAGDNTQRLIEFGKHLWNISPGRISWLMDTKPNALPVEAEDELVAVTEWVRKYAPFFGPAFGRYVRVQRYGREERVHLLANVARERRAVINVWANVAARKARTSNVPLSEIMEEYEFKSPYEQMLFQDTYTDCLNEPISTEQQKMRKTTQSDMEYLFKYQPDVWRELIQKQ